MISSTCRPLIRPGRRGAVALTACALALTSLGLAGCAAVSDIKKVTHDVAANRATVDAFAQTLQLGQATPFEARYVTTGSSPATIVYAVRPPQDVAFTDTPAGGQGAENLHLVVNASGAYSCSRPATGARWTCEKLGRSSAATRNKILDLYTPSHWVAFLKEFALAAGFAGDKVGTGTATVNGFRMKCVTFQAAGIRGTSKICTTAQGILGYVKVASVATSFEITSYTTAPSPAVFRLPAHAKIKNLKTKTG